MRFQPAMLRSRDFREENRPPSTPNIVSVRNDLAQTRQLIEARQKEIELELRVLQAEQTNLQLNWDATCEEWNRVWARGLP